MGAEDRAAITLRFFERRDFRSIGEALGSTEDAAQKRVTGALEKLRRMLVSRGATASVAGLAAGLGTTLVVEHQTSAKLREQNRALTVPPVNLPSWTSRGRPVGV